MKWAALDGTSAMSLKSSYAVVIVAIVFLAIANGAQAGVGEYARGAPLSLKFMTPVEKAQYYSLDDNSNYCWYNNGWQGPGWYLCGDEWLNGFGWGGPYGWNGWGGGYWIRRHGSHGIGVWHPGAPNKVFGGAASPSPPTSGAPASPGFQGGGVPAFHGFGGGGPEDFMAAAVEPYFRWTRRRRPSLNFFQACPLQCLPQNSERRDRPFAGRSRPPLRPAHQLRDAVAAPLTPGRAARTRSRGRRRRCRARLPPRWSRVERRAPSRRA